MYYHQYTFQCMHFGIISIAFTISTLLSFNNETVYLIGDTSLEISLPIHVFSFCGTISFKTLPAYFHECNVDKNLTKILHSTRARNTRRIHDILRFFNPKLHCQRITQAYMVHVNNKSIQISFGDHSRPLCAYKTRQNFL